MIHPIVNADVDMECSWDEDDNPSVTIEVKLQLEEDNVIFEFNDRPNATFNLGDLLSVLKILETVRNEKSGLARRNLKAGYTP